jgi:hypothetical protein
LYVRSSVEGCIDWARIDLAEQLGEVTLVLRRPDIFDPALAPLLRRFACTCCRAVQHHLTDEASREAMAVIERFACGSASFEELVHARDAAKLAARQARRHMPRNSHAYAASAAVRDAGRNNAFEAILLSSRAAKRAGLSIRRQAELFQRLYAAWLEDKSFTESL